MKKFFFALLSMAAMTAFAQMTPVGLWHTIDDKTNQPKGEVRIFEKDGALVGVVGRALKEDPNAKPNCDKCVDDRKGQPIIGMEILRGLKREGKESENLFMFLFAKKNGIPCKPSTQKQKAEACWLVSMKAFMMHGK